jgi:hypothetical protein
MSKLKKASDVEMYVFHLFGDRYEEYIAVSDLFDFLSDNPRVIYEALKQAYPNDTYRVQPHTLEILNSIKETNDEAAKEDTK